jgi:hypothetical protein
MGKQEYTLLFCPSISISKYPEEVWLQCWAAVSLKNTVQLCSV